MSDPTPDDAPRLRAMAAQLVLASSVYAQARHDAEVARVALVAAIRAAAAAGEPERRIAERAHIARMTVRKALGKDVARSTRRRRSERRPRARLAG